MNSSTNKEIVSALGLQNIDALPTPIAVVNVNPKDYKLTNLSSYTSITTTGGAGIHTCSSTRRTLITGAILSVAKNATCDVSTDFTGISYVQGAVTKYMILKSFVPSTADAETIVANFKEPIEPDKGSQILIIGNNFTTGALKKAGAVFGYELDTYE